MYEKMEIEPFGRHLIETGDLDPVYIALVGAALPEDQRKRWLVSYFSFYSVGSASYMSEREGAEFWLKMKSAAANSGGCPLGSAARWPRAAERRHFRGQACVTAVQQLQERYPEPEAMIDYIYGGRDGPTGPVPFKEILERVKEHYLFGPWIGWKIADVLEQCMGASISYEQADVFMFEAPAKAVDIVWERRVAPIARTKLDASERRRRVVSNLSLAFNDLKAPPLYNRAIGLMEIETVLCKFSSHLNGHYPLGKDTHEVRESLTAWCCCSETSKLLLAALPKDGVQI